MYGSHKSDIEHRFTYHPPKDDVQTGRFESVRSSIKDLAHHLDIICPDSWEKDESFKRLDAAMFWANASIARNE